MFNRNAGRNNKKRYWSDLKIKLKEEGFEVSDIIGQLKLPAPNMFLGNDLGNDLYEILNPDK